MRCFCDVSIFRWSCLTFHYGQVALNYSCSISSTSILTPFHPLRTRMGLPMSSSSSPLDFASNGSSYIISAIFNMVPWLYVASAHPSSFNILKEIIPLHLSSAPLHLDLTLPGTKGLLPVEAVIHLYFLLWWHWSNRPLHWRHNRLCDTK